MNVWKRVGLIIVMALCVLFFLTSVAAIFGAWVYRGPLISQLQDFFQIADRALDQATGFLDQLDQALSEAVGLTRELQSTYDSVVDGLKEWSVAIDEMAGEVRTSLEPVEMQLEDFTQGLREAYISLDTFIQGLNEIPFVRLETPGKELVQTIDETMRDLEQQVEELKAGIDSFTAQTEEAISQLGLMIDGTERILQTYQDYAVELREDLLETQTSMEALKGRIPGIITWLAVIVTLFSTWVGLGQVAVFALGRSMLKGGDPRALLQAQE